MLGVLSMVYLGCIHWVLVTVFMPQFLLRQNSKSDLPIEQQLLLQQGDTGTIQWVLITTLGGFASAAVLLCRGAPDPGSVRNIFHDIHDLKVSIDLCIYMCVHTHESENERLLLAVVLVVVVCGAMISTGRILTVPNRRRAFPPPCCTQPQHHPSHPSICPFSPLVYTGHPIRDTIRSLVMFRGTHHRRTIGT